MKGPRALLGAFVRSQNETLDPEHLEVRIPGLPAAQDGFRIAVISDLHISAVKAMHHDVLREVAAFRPGCILIPGDTVDEIERDYHALDAFFAPLGRIAPVIASLGNNDCELVYTDKLRDLYQRCGVTLLEDETRLMMANGRPLRVTGLTDPYAEKCGVKPPSRPGDFQTMPGAQAVTPSLEADSGEMIPTILLVHRPDRAALYAPLKPSLIVSGHAHGGQFRLPLIGPLFAPDQGVFPRLTSGCYPIGDTTLIVSRGIGTHSFPLRLFNHPHLPLVTLRRASE